MLLNNTVITKAYIYLGIRTIGISATNQNKNHSIIRKRTLTLQASIRTDSYYFFPGAVLIGLFIPSGGIWISIHLVMDLCSPNKNYN